MSLKKSYMNKGNILEEGFFDKILDKLFGRDKSLKSQMLRDKGLQKSILKLNNSANELEDYLNSLSKGEKISLGKYKIGDFTK